MRRPVPTRTESIGPWQGTLNALGILSSVTQSSLVYMFSSGLSVDCTIHTLLGGFVVVVLAEHAYMLLRHSIRAVMARNATDAEQRHLHNSYTFRKRYLHKIASSLPDVQEKVSTSTTPDKFWDKRNESAAEVLAKLADGRKTK